MSFLEQFILYMVMENIWRFFSQTLNLYANRTTTFKTTSIWSSSTFFLLLNAYLKNLLVAIRRFYTHNSHTYELDMNYMI